MKIPPIDDGAPPPVLRAVQAWLLDQRNQAKGYKDTVDRDRTIKRCEAMIDRIDMILEPRELYEDPGEQYFD